MSEDLWPDMDPHVEEVSTAEGKFWVAQLVDRVDRSVRWESERFATAEEAIKASRDAYFDAFDR